MDSAKQQGSSYAPTKPSIKSIPAKTLSQASYLEGVLTAEEPPKTSTAKRPSGSYAPTQSSVRHLSGRNGTLLEGSYLEGLRDGFKALTSFAQEHPAENLSAESTPPRASTVKRPASYAPTRSSVRYLSGRNGTSLEGSYLEGLRDGFSVLTSFAQDQPTEPIPVELTPPRAFVTKRPGSYAPTQSSVKYLSGRNGTLLEGSYLEGLRDGFNILSSFAQDRPAETIPSPPTELIADVRPTGTASEPSANSLSMEPALRAFVAERPSGNYAPTHSSVKHLSGRSGTSLEGSYLEGLRDGVNALGSFAETVSPGTLSTELDSFNELVNKVITQVQESHGDLKDNPSASRMSYAPWASGRKSWKRGCTDDDLYQRGIAETR
jgi:hypothetical protein